LNVNWEEPEDNSAENVEASERALQFAVGWYANPIFGDGDYRAVMIDQVVVHFRLPFHPLNETIEQIGRMSAAQGFPKSRLPEFTELEKQQLKGSADFFGLNFYTSNMAKNKVQDINWISYDADKDTESYQDPAWFG